MMKKGRWKRDEKKDKWEKVVKVFVSAVALPNFNCIYTFGYWLKKYASTRLLRFGERYHLTTSASFTVWSFAQFFCKRLN